MIVPNFELSLSLVVVLFLTAVYIIYEALSVPAGGHPFGHALGILGATLMLMTELLYSARKRWRILHFGRLRHWLSFHIFTGIVGPTLVLMHTGFEFRGLAGVTMFLTVVVVASGFIGRFIYTAVPRTMAGIEVNRRTLEFQTSERQRAMMAWSTGKSERIQALIREEIALTSRASKVSTWNVLSHNLQEYRDRRRLRKQIRKLEKEEQVRLAEIERLINQQRRLTQQIGSLQKVRQMMVLWRTLHIPLGLTLFTAMFIHIFASIYYSGI